jgi:putative membrane protein
MGLIINLLLQALAVFITGYLLQAGVVVGNFTTALLVAVVLGIANILVKPIIFLLTLPLNILTLGLFTFIINGLIILLVSNLVSGFYVKNIWWAILFSLVLSLVSSFLNSLSK